MDPKLPQAQLTGCHRLPQIPKMGRNVRQAQSKSSARSSLYSKTESVENDNPSQYVNFWTGNEADVDVKDPLSNIEISDNKQSELDKVNSSSANLDVSDSLKSEEKVENQLLSPEKNKGKSPKKATSNKKPSTNLSKPEKKRKSLSSSIDSEKLIAVKDKACPKKKSRDSSMQATLNLGEDLLTVQEKKKVSMQEAVSKTEPQMQTEIGQLENGEASGIHIPRCVIISPKEVPSDTQKEKLLEMQSVSFDLENPPLWKEGDMLWGKVCGHPYWPCMISPCPFTQMLSRVRASGITSRSYHVQFFGNACERGWLFESSLMDYNGREHFTELVRIDSLKPKTVKKGKSSYNPFRINAGRIDEWNLSVDEAEEAYKLDIKDRLLQYTFDYVFVDSSYIKKKATPSASLPLKRKRQDSSSISPKAKKGKFVKQSSYGPEENKTGADCSFDIYYAKNRDKVMEMNPDWDSSAVFDYLKQQWSSLSPPASNTGLDTTPASGKRTKKPTMKLVESMCQARPYSDTTPSKSEESPRRRGRPKKMSLPVDATSSIVDSKEETPSKQILPQSVSSGLSSQVSELSEITSSQTKKNLRKISQATKELLPCSHQTGDTEEVSLPKSAEAVTMLYSLKSSHDSDSNSSTESKSKKVKKYEPSDLEIFKLQSTSKIEKENICSVCEDNGDLVECKGSCCRHFHLKCLPTVPKRVNEFKCEDCSTGVHACFSCKGSDGLTKKCSVNQCGKYFHEECLKKLRLTRTSGDNKGFICPLHTCHTCSVDSTKKLKATKGRLFKCIRCPKAYHIGDFCIAAGSEVLGAGYIICSDHFQPNKSLSSHAHVNITWCFLCSKGGALLCCESCPASYHPECVKMEKMPDEAWFCEECTAGARPLYGNIVWIKVGNYRWWPGSVCHPRHVPLNIQEKMHQVGEFPVRFFGSHDYYWMHRGRVFLFEEGDKASRDKSSKSLYKIYTRGVEEATEAFKLWKTTQEKKEEQEQERSDKKPSTYRFVKKNIPLGNVQIHVAELSEIPRCDCKENQEDPCSSDCLNRMMMYECHPSVCPAKEKCNNQRFQKRQYAQCEPVRSGGRGWGLQAAQDIKKGQFVMEYVGDLIDEEECKKRIVEAHESNITNFYMLTMDKNRIIDAGPRGNNSRFMNHSCCPNLETQKWMVAGDIRVGLFTLCDIDKGTELTFNYNLECLGNEKTACACGAENCSGFLGVRPKTAAAMANERKLKEMKKKKKKKMDLRKEHEDDCFRCGEGGELVMCDKGSCPKVYHLQCLKLTKPPTGKWLCPWHHCDLCGRTAISLCTECPNSFCQVHSDGNISKVGDCLICSDHEDIEELSKSLCEETGPRVTTNETSETDQIEMRNSQDYKSDSLVSERIENKNLQSKTDTRNVQSNRKVVKRKSFKDILKEGSNSTVVPSRKAKGDISNTSKCMTDTTIAKNNKKGKNIPNGFSEVSNRGDGNHCPSQQINEPEEKIGIRLKKTQSPGGKKDKMLNSRTRYRAQLLSQTPDSTSRPTNGLPPRMSTRNVEDSEDNDSISDLVIDIP